MRVSNCNFDVHVFFDAIGTSRSFFVVICVFVVRLLVVNSRLR